MHNRVIALALITLLVVVHAQLWIGRGSIPDVQALGEAVEAQKAKNTQAQQLNTQLSEEVRDLQEGMEIVEEKARYELGMVRPNEILVQIAR